MSDAAIGNSVASFLEAVAEVTPPAPAAPAEAEPKAGAKPAPKPKPKPKPRPKPKPGPKPTEHEGEDDGEDLALEQTMLRETATRVRNVVAAGDAITLGLIVEAVACFAEDVEELVEEEPLEDEDDGTQDAGRVKRDEE